MLGSVELYKVGTIHDVTLQKYLVIYRKIKALAPDLMMKDLNHQTYQKLLNDYAINHERQTVMESKQQF